MREIKFRFWLGHTGKMTYGHTLSEIPSIIKEFTSDIISLEFTGLKDKNGIEIYEGDILSVSGRKKVGNYVTEIIWEHSGYKLKENNTYVNDGYFPKNMIEVIGNKFENPELLTK